MERLYTDIHGIQHPKAHINKHHTFFRHTVKGKGGIYRRFIDQHGLCIPIMVSEHRALHQEVDAPPVPSASLIHRIGMYVSNLPSQNPYDRFISITEFLEQVSDKCPNSDHRSQAGYIADNLQRQAPFILEGQVQIQPLQEVA